MGRTCRLHTDNSLFNHHTVTIPILQVKKLRHTKVKGIFSSAELTVKFKRLIFLIKKNVEAQVKKKMKLINNLKIRCY